MQSATLEDVKEGWQIMLENRDEWHNTSKIREVVSREPHKVVFKTQTSLYELVRTVEGN